MSPLNPADQDAISPSHNALVQRLAALAPTSRSFDTPEDVQRIWQLFTWRDDGPREVRILKTDQGTVSGIFTDAASAIEAAQDWDGVRSVYVTANPLKPEMLARENVGQLTPYCKMTTTDQDIARRVWMIVDIDPVTPVKGVSGTDEEQERALIVRDYVAHWLKTKLAFPEPISGQSGNGGRLLYAIDLPNNETVTKLLKNCLKAIAAHWTSKGVEIDTSVFNAARIDKLWGTIAVKGKATSDRPHRRSFLDHVPRGNVSGCVNEEKAV